MSELLEKIRSGGHWRVAIRPADFQQERLDLGDLEPLIVSRQVQLRGWYFPHISFGQPIVNGADWIGQESESSTGSAYLESWRFFTSGQFAWVRSFRNEWPGGDVSIQDKTLAVYEVINVATESCELAARLALTNAGGDSTYLRIVAAGLLGRRLIVGDPRRGELDGVAGTVDNEIRRESIFDRADLIANPRTHALDIAVWLLQRLGWRSASRSIAREIQEEIFGASRDG